MAAVGRQAIDVQHREVQAGWLAESALDRAAARLGADGHYTGEVWTIAPDPTGLPHSARIEIRVETIPGQPGQRLVRVRADYPDHPHDRARETRQTIVQLAKGTNP